MKIKHLHKTAYNQLTKYYADLTEPMALLRRNILNIILMGKKSVDEIKMIGPFKIDEEIIPAINKENSILDMGCANGDNLTLMRDMGYSKLSGIDIAPEMVATAKERTELTIHCGDFFEYAGPPVDFLFAQAVVHLFPKADLQNILKRMLSFSKKRLYFSTTIHDQASEGLEPKMQVMRYRSRYTNEELLNHIHDVLESVNQKENTWRIFYFYLSDCLGKYWINVVFDKIDLTACYNKDGVIIYRQLIKKNSIATLGKALDYFAENKAPENTWLRYDDGPLFDRVENFIPYLNLATCENLFSPFIMKLLEKCFNNKVVLLKDKCNFKPPQKSDFPLHQDAAAGWESRGYGKKHMTLAISVDKACLENGTLQFVLQKHQEGLFSALYETIHQDYLQQWHFHPVVMLPGDAVIFDSYTPHYSKKNLSQSSRKIIFLTYIDAKYANLAKQFFRDKILTQPPMDKRVNNVHLVRNEYGKWIKVE